MYIYLNLPHDLAQMLFPTYMYMYMGKVYGGKRNFVFALYSCSWEQGTVQL